MAEIALGNNKDDWRKSKDELPPEGVDAVFRWRDDHTYMWFGRNVGGKILLQGGRACQGLQSVGCGWDEWQIPMKERTQDA